MKFNLYIYGQAEKQNLKLVAHFEFFYSLFCSKTAPPNANGGASEKAPSIGQTSHGRTILEFDLKISHTYAIIQANSIHNEIKYLRTKVLTAL